jgi:hypothetical protein
MTGAVAGLLSSYGAAPPATLAYYFDAAALGAFPGVAITSSATFNGTTKYMSATSGVLTFTGDFTVEGWFYPSSVTGTHSLFTLGTETTGRYTWQLNGAVINSNLFGSSSVAYNSTLTINTWYHIAVVRSGTTVTLYVNGTADATTDTQAGTIGNGALNIGADGSGATFFAGNMSNFRILSSALYSGASLSVPTVTLRAVAGTQFLAPLTANPFMDISTNLLTVNNATGTVTSAIAPSLTAATTDVTGVYPLSYSNASGRISWVSTQGGIFRNAFSGDAINAYITGGPDWQTSRSYTVFVGYKLTGTSNYGRLINSNTASPDWMMGGYSSHPKVFWSSSGSVNLSSATIDTTWHLDWGRYNKTTNVGDLFSVTGSQPTATPTYTLSAANMLPFSQLKLFSKSDGNECAAGDIAFIRAWDGAMTTAQMQAEWTAFHTRVGF